ncbi:hypothetical protein Cyagr_0281 [Cyanobium gracile PCC 6307]|uniref:Uncharacterized protein n=1 Tax=Cyanobium gracile (strain ATCC 27147 / PCC 6307) TaxID=292564 RepID=K9P326_CYAGP|nr:hypothetical protein Cyagr_0281 [Cyanobium gracile PCC 6307]
MPQVPMLSYPNVCLNQWGRFRLVIHHLDSGRCHNELAAVNGYCCE